MSKAKHSQRALKLMASLAMLSAVSIVLGKYLAINLGEVLRLSFENLPIIFAGIAFGPGSGVIVGVVSDLVGCVLVGYTVNPIVTAGAALIGAVSGACALVCKRLYRAGSIVTVAVSTASAHIIGSVIVKTLGLASFYDMPFTILMFWRLLNYVIIGVAEGVLLSYLFKSNAIKKAVGSIIMSVKDNEKFSSYANSFQAVTVPGLERISALLAALGNPQENLRFIHIAGTNGKGSVSANISCILEDAGYRTGKYISPNLIRVNERISVNGADISDEDMNRILAEIEPHARAVEIEGGIAPTQFEIWTALAFVYFKRKRCDYVVLEVGLGGEFDATNVIKRNVLAVITRLGIDHTQYLGNTLAEVAKAKCGIIKRDSELSTLVTVRQNEEAMPVIQKFAAERGSKLIVAEPESLGADGYLERFSLDGEEYLCGIAGYHQIENAAIAVLAAREMGISESNIKSGIARAKNPARFEIIETDPVVVYDGGHNENGIRALNRSLERYFGKARKTVVFACMADKDIKESLELLSNGDTEFIFTTVKNNPRAMTAEALAKKAEALGFSGEACEEIGNAYYKARELGRLTVICGSLYLYRDFREFYDNVN